MGAPFPHGGVRAAVLGYVRSYQAANHDSPSLGEIAVGVGTSKPHVSAILDRLEEDGALRRLPAGTRQKRPIVLANDLDSAIATLRALGWIIDNDVRSAAPPISRS
jgi:predicted transcriptional regulator